MKALFFPRLAFDGIRKNKRMYLPFILTCIGMVTMYYIVLFLQYNQAVYQLPGVYVLLAFLNVGSWIIAFFACIFLFYTNSFLIRRRKREFGLYNILGMGKGKIGRILFWETLFILAFSLLTGLAAGIAFSKLAELAMFRLMQGDAPYHFFISVQAIGRTAVVFGAIFLLLFLNGLRQVRFSSAVSLLRSENVGEKPPKANWFFGILGVLILAGAYYIAVTIQNPLAAIYAFLVAAVMVIIGTYLLLISGSILFCRILQKKKSYYYKPGPFVSVSSMVYRMKRNGAGLASICILSTMVLVMISTSACLYFGSEDSLHTRYPREINMDFKLQEVEDLSDERIGALRSYLQGIAEEEGITPENCYEFRCIYIAGLLQDNIVETDASKLDSLSISSMTDIYQFYFVSLADYNAMMGTDETLKAGEALLYPYRSSYKGDNISFNLGNTFHIKKQVEKFNSTGDIAMAIIPSIAIIVPDLNEAIQGLDTLADYNGNRMITPQWTYFFDTGADTEQQMAVYDRLNASFPSEIWKQYHLYSCEISSRDLNRGQYYGLFGGFLYFGILLSIVFSLAAVLIIYYKQISEGYEDQARFTIMQKVGMTKREIRKSINSQLLTVFFLPPLLAACHLVFSFPIIRKLLLLLNLNNVWLFAQTTMICFLIFAVLYTIVYRITSNAYYRIVSGAKQ